MSNDFNQQVIDEFRANRGRVGGRFEGARLLLLTTTGARSGAPHTTPVGYLPDGGERVLVIASAGGSPKHPDWYHNILANPRLTVEDGVFTYEAGAVVLGGEERDRAFARAVEADPGWAEYQAKTERVIPVVALESVENGPPSTGTTSMGEAVKAVHDAFRRELALIRAETTASGPRLGAQLRINCLTLCQGLHNHHTGEDTALFPFLAGRYEELAPVMDRLREEHGRIATLLDELRRIVTADGTEPALVQAEVGRLAEELEAHLTYEEEQLIPVLDAAAR
ncbi:nitroreductase/quinone reductase family protein [Streptomyces sp. HNM0645]|uniref:nitroreductase/quinone reductase family protein n=1 Tax=Streptomyces sp. HNM0645 TaxID=2782343 RepID=UPI0024B6774D|nr:nitroreductase/quinone reductase family protein [Streptomyces sp. HNM0645]MDI9887191.1 nitroreductase/quinone reductase family protein [Streptomyces sp. HNM0645]